MSKGTGIIIFLTGAAVGFIGSAFLYKKKIIEMKSDMEAIESNCARRIEVVKARYEEKLAGMEEDAEEDRSNMIDDLLKKASERDLSSNRYSSDDQIKKFKSIEETNEVKEEIMSKITPSIISEKKYDSLRREGVDFDVIEYHTETEEFTLENGEIFPGFDDMGIEETVKEKVLKAPYTKGAFVYDPEEDKCYEVVRIDRKDEVYDDEDEFDEEGEGEDLDPEEAERRDSFPEPETIPEEDFAETNLGFDKVDVSYDERTNQFIKEGGEIIDHPITIFGVDLVAEAKKRGAAVYEVFVRNYELETDYHVVIG